MTANRILSTSCAIVIATLVSCSPATLAPRAKVVGLDPYGSIIRVDGYPKEYQWTMGELIAVDLTGIYVLEERSGKVLRIEKASAMEYELFPARSRSYAAFIPLSVALSITHGGFALLTLPMNLISTISVAAAGPAQFRYTEKDVDYTNLYMFSRFPQGLPKGIDLHKLKGRTTSTP